MNEAMRHIDLIAIFTPYLLIFARTSALFTIAPGFGDHSLPIRYRLVFALAFAVIIKDILPPLPVPSHHIDIIALFMQEILIGFVMGSVARLFLSILDILGTIMGMQIGLGNAMMFNPSLSMQATVVEQFIVLSGVMMFMAMDGPHLLLKSIINSYDVFSYLPSNNPTELSHTLHDFLPVFQKFPSFFAHAFHVACQISLPFLILGLLFQVVLGLMNRIVPSIQIFFIALPLQILLGIFLMLLITGLCLRLSMEHFWPSYEAFFRTA